jgi:hypothetical protein
MESLSLSLGPVELHYVGDVETRDKNKILIKDNEITHISVKC